MKALLSLAAALLSAVTVAAPAQADPADDQFIQNIRTVFGREVTDPQGAIDEARDICNSLHHKKTYDQLVMQLRQANTDWDANQAAFFVSESAETYCPELMAP
jgi:Protein of unknown function (DUF732)